MVESQLDLEKNRQKFKEKFSDLMPGFWKAHRSLQAEIYKDGAISLKVKRLISLAVGLRACCKNCILGQTTLALEAGVTVEELLETCMVVAAMSGTTGIGESLRVIQLLEEMGKL